jgi:capsular polysaccharide transport system ATP-binding protein
VITLHSVSKEVGRGHLRKLVLDNVSWTIPPRTNIVVLGRRGSGKSTLLKVVGGFQIPTSGWVERRATVSAPGGYLRYARGEITPRQLATRIAHLYRLKPGELVEFTTYFAGLDSLMNVPVTELPVKLRVLFSFALIYAVPVDFYLFDGAFGVRGGPFAARCQQAFEARRKEAGVILVTHNVRLASQFEGAGAIIHRGKLILFETAAEAVSAFASVPHEADEPGHREDPYDPYGRNEEIFE